MALIGTISGSVGAGGSLVSATAISGTLIIADAPPSSFPAIQSGVKLFVSGNKTELGADSPNAIFGGDTFVSGAFGTDSYFQMKPVNTLRIPTNTTASYIYTSGSTNDMYFTQYSGLYTNTTRLRWLESQIHTGLLHGGVISAAVGGTTFSVTAGEGIIVSQNAFTASSPYPTVNNVKWNAVVSQSLTYVATNQITYLGVNASGGIFQQSTPISLTDDANYISLGRVLHQTGSVVNGSVTMPIVSYGGTQFINDFVRAIGPLKVSGHVLAASGSTLSITKTSGVSYVQGRNYTVNPDSPDVITEVSDTPVTVSKIFYQHVSGSTIIQNTGVGAAGFTVIDPTQYNNNGTLTALSNNNKFSIQRVYWYPNSVTRAFTVYYGSAEYDTLNDAQAGITTETFTEGNNTVDAAILVAYILVQKVCSSLANTDTSRIVQAGTFRGTGIGGGGGTASSTVPGGLDTYVQFNDGGSTFGGDAGLTYNKSTDTLTVAGDIAVDGGDITTSATTFNLVNATATTINLGGGASAINIGAAGSATTFAGNITGSNALLSGDLAVNGGDITTSAATFNLITGSATTVNFAGAATALTIGANGTGATTIRNVITSSAGKIALTNAAGSLISFPVGGGALGPPTFTNSSVGSRLLLYPSVGASSADWAIGMESQAMWFGVNVATTTPRFKWYAGTTEIASLRGDGLFTVTGSLATSTGNIIGAPGTGQNVMTLISSGNIIAKIDTDNSAEGHKFAVRDWRDIDQFSVGENGNAELSGSLVVSGSSIQTVTTTTYNLLTSALTGTLNIGNLTNTIAIGGTNTTSSIQGAAQIDGRSTLSSITEKMVPSVGGTGTVNYDLSLASIFYTNGPTGDVTANFTNVPTTNNRIITPTVILSQSATARIVSAVQIDTAAQTINWANGVTPTGTANKQDVFGFSLIRSGSTWKVLGQMSTYG